MLGAHPEWKDNVQQYCRGWFKDGLDDRAVTRDLAWGVPVPLPDHEGKVLYVWFDAPIGYISSTREWAAAQGDPEAWRTVVAGSRARAWSTSSARTTSSSTR